MCVRVETGRQDGQVLPQVWKGIVMMSIFQMLHELSGKPGKWNDDIEDIPEVSTWGWVGFAIFVTVFIWVAIKLAEAVSS